MSTKTKRTEVAQLTYFVVQTYKAVKGRRTEVSADNPMPARDEDHALRLFERYKPIRAGVVAFRRTGNPATGDWEDAVVVTKHGILPPEVLGLQDASEIEADSWDLGDADLKVA